MEWSQNQPAKKRRIDVNEDPEAVPIGTLQSLHHYNMPISILHPNHNSSIRPRILPNLQPERPPFNLSSPQPQMTPFAHQHLNPFPQHNTVTGTPWHISAGHVNYEWLRKRKFMAYQAAMPPVFPEQVQTNSASESVLPMSPFAPQIYRPVPQIMVQNQPAVSSGQFEIRSSSVLAQDMCTETSDTAYLIPNLVVSSKKEDIVCFGVVCASFRLLRRQKLNSPSSQMSQLELVDNI
jgi:hypothetical protein